MWDWTLKPEGVFGGHQNIGRYWELHKHDQIYKTP